MGISYGRAMDEQVTGQRLEASLVRMCAPALLGAKPANMFTFVGKYADADQVAVGRMQGARGYVCPGERDGDCACRPCPCSLVEGRRSELSRAVRSFDRILQDHGVRVRVVAWRSFGAIVLAYRPQMLAEHLADERMQTALERLGYPVWQAMGGDAGEMSLLMLGQQLDHLSQRFAAEKLPHEVGFFLGYPYEDVMGFVRHRGRRYRYSGCWKVYGDPRPAVRLFARYRRCTRRCERLRNTGATLIDIVAFHRFFEM